MKNKSHNQPLLDERLELLFRHAGLSEKQAKLYRLLLITGEERPSVLARKSGIKRANTYALLIDLARHGLVHQFEKDKIIYFRPESPKRLSDIIEARQKEAAIAKELSQDLLPNLTSQYNLSVGKPTISYFEGEEGVKTVFRDIYAPKKEPVLGCVDLETANTVFPSYITHDLIPLRVKNKLFAYSIVADSPAAQVLKRQDASQLRKTVLVSKDTYPLPAEIDLYEDKIAMLSFEKGKFIGMIIQNKSFATTLRSIFKLAIGPEKQV
jgi:sugar-specific transcriptional regulator TrmB